MLRSWMGSLAVAMMAWPTSGCLRTTTFECATNTECAQAGAQGTCEAVGFCSFADTACGSGQRFGGLSGPFANQCVPTPDAAIDAPPDAPPIDMFVPDARECFGAGAYELCFAGMPPMGVVALAGAVDTDTDARCVAMPASWTTAGQPDACMIVGATINVNGNLAVTGTTNRRPLVLVGHTITIGAVIDVASHRGVAAPAPGSPSLACAAPTQVPVDLAAGAGAGAGGTFRSRGGAGGLGDGNVNGGIAAAVGPAPTILRGGCDGQLGGTGTAAPGAVGLGGGAIYIAAESLVITGTGAINASGSGGSGGGTFSGGSGGGSGGMIVVHAVQATVTGGKLMANGGGGASGATNTVGGSGGDPMVATPTTPAVGGNGGGAKGGAGAAGATVAAAGSTQNNRGGGGGGGGGGYIQSNLSLAGATVSPAATIVP